MKPCDIGECADCDDVRACQICGKVMRYCDWLDCEGAGCPQKWWHKPPEIPLPPSLRHLLQEEEK